jgi:hypothetical protein
MRRRATQVLVMLGFCWLCFAGPIFAQNSNHENQGNHGNEGNHGHQGQRVAAPEIDVVVGAGALTLAAGVLALLRERLRR